MSIKARSSFLLLLSLCAFTPRIASAAAPTDHWVGTWATSPMAAKNPDGKFGAPGTDGTTLREIVHISIGGPSVRVILTNEFGLDPLTISAAQVALSSGTSAITPGTATARLRSICRMRACACGERSTFRCSMPGMAKSSV